jgi:hypothetical protein
MATKKPISFLCSSGLSFLRIEPLGFKLEFFQFHAKRLILTGNFGKESQAATGTPSSGRK